MRNCDNCYNGHYNLSDRGEELFCDESEFTEELVDSDGVCEYHRYYPGMEEEKNYVFYDEHYLGPGYLIVNVKNGSISKFFKIYDASSNGVPNIGIRAYSKDSTENPEEKFSSIDFSFRDIEDCDNGLFKLFSSLCYEVTSDRLFTVDSQVQGYNHLKIDSNLKVVNVTLCKDTFNGTQHPCDYIDVLLGDAYTCEDFEAINKLYCGLSEICMRSLSSNDVKKMLFG